MQPCSREMQAMNLSLMNQNQQISLHDLHQFDSGGASTSNDDFLDQIFSSNSWPPPLDPNLTAVKPPPQSPWDPVGSMEDQSSFLASKLRQHQIGGAKALLLQQQLMLSSRGLANAGNGLRSPGPGAANGLLPLPLNLSGNDDQNDVMLDGSPFKSSGNEVASVQALFNGFNGGSLGQTSSQTPHFHHSQNFNTPAMNQVAAAAASGSAAAGAGGGAVTAGQPRQQRVRARRGQATDPHSIAERLRRERIAERMKALQELVPNANKTDKASMLDEIIDYVKFLQLQVKVLSMSRLGGAAAVAPLVADMSSEGGNENGRSSNGTQTASSSDSMTVTEHQVAKLMEEDMGSAMQYLQGKGLCLMPISLATAISTATCHSRNPLIPGRSGPTSPSMSGLTVQSATMVNGGGGAEPSSVKDAVSVSKP